MVSGARYVWLCSFGQGRGVGRYFICILRACGVGMEKPYKVKQGEQPNNCESNKFFLGLMVGELILWRRLGGGR